MCIRDRIKTTEVHPAESTVDSEEEGKKREEDPRNSPRPSVDHSSSPQISPRLSGSSSPRDRGVTSTIPATDLPPAETNFDSYADWKRQNTPRGSRSDRTAERGPSGERPLSPRRGRRTTDKPVTGTIAQTEHQPETPTSFGSYDDWKRQTTPRGTTARNQPDAAQVALDAPTEEESPTMSPRSSHKSEYAWMKKFREQNKEQEPTTATARETQNQSALEKETARRQRQRADAEEREAQEALRRQREFEDIRRRHQAAERVDQSRRANRVEAASGGGRNPITPRHVLDAEGIHAQPPPDNTEWVQALLTSSPPR
eukprot:TRINITY_DN11318_c0_g2_i1.p1 TRINITY_DN11318_c0_g2~~TRINITY_DN11318_c0_g2_i1.p1  ORF type:complete len:314 (+),score=69.67 TRINITY_DN11318_c0_g2_i1:130-1071(+)